MRAGTEKLQTDALGCGASIGVAAAAAFLFAALGILLCQITELMGVHPTSSLAVSVAAAGAVSGLLLGHWRLRGSWLVAPAFLLVIILAPVPPIVLLAGLGDSVPPVGFIIGSAAAIVLGLVAISVAARGRGRRLALARALGALTLMGALVLTGSGVRSRQQFARINDDVLPAIEDLVARDVLVSTGPVYWTPPRYVTLGNGVPFVSCTGQMNAPRVFLHINNTTSRRIRGPAGSAEGLRVNGLRLDVPQPRDLIGDERQDPETVKRLLRLMGLRPELVDSYREGRTTYHGVTYKFEFNVYSGSDITVVHCSGVRTTAP